jgi:hypothetical protein
MWAQLRLRYTDRGRRSALHPTGYRKIRADERVAGPRAEGGAGFASRAVRRATRRAGAVWRGA